MYQLLYKIISLNNYSTYLTSPTFLKNNLNVKHLERTRCFLYFFIFLYTAEFMEHMSVPIHCGRVQRLSLL